MLNGGCLAQSATCFLIIRLSGRSQLNASECRGGSQLAETGDNGLGGAGSPQHRRVRAGCISEGSAARSRGGHDRQWRREPPSGGSPAETGGGGSRSCPG